MAARCAAGAAIACISRRSASRWSCCSTTWRTRRPPPTTRSPPSSTARSRRPTRSCRPRPGLAPMSSPRRDWRRGSTSTRPASCGLRFSPAPERLRLQPDGSRHVRPRHAARRRRRAVARAARREPAYASRTRRRRRSGARHRRQVSLRLARRGDRDPSMPAARCMAPARVRSARDAWSCSSRSARISGRCPAHARSTFRRRATGTLAFKRDAAGRITGATVGCWLARGLAYDRMP